MIDFRICRYGTIRKMVVVIRLQVWRRLPWFKGGVLFR